MIGGAHTNSIAQIAALSSGLSGVAQGVGGFIQQESAADAERAVARAQERRTRRLRRRQMASARAEFGARGAQLVGTPLDVLADQAAEAEEEALLVRFGGEQRAGRRDRAATTSLLSGFGTGASRFAQTGSALNIFDPGPDGMTA